MSLPNPTPSTLLFSEAAHYFAISFSPVEIRISLGQGAMQSYPGQCPVDGGVIWRGALSTSPHAAKALLRDLQAAIGLYEDKFGAISLPPPERGEVAKVAPRAVPPAEPDDRG